MPLVAVIQTCPFYNSRVPSHRAGQADYQGHQRGVKVAWATWSRDVGSLFQPLQDLTQAAPAQVGRAGAALHAEEQSSRRLPLPAPRKRQLPTDPCGQARPGQNTEKMSAVEGAEPSEPRAGTWGCGVGLLGVRIFEGEWRHSITMALNATLRCQLVSRNVYVISI